MKEAKKFSFLRISTRAVVFVLLAVLLNPCGRIASTGENTDTGITDILPAGFTYTDSDDTPCSGNITVLGDPEVVGDYLYWEGGTTLMRYNVRTGNITTVCADPLCDHKPTAARFTI